MLTLLWAHLHFARADVFPDKVWPVRQCIARVLCRTMPQPQLETSSRHNH